MSFISCNMVPAFDRRSLILNNTSCVDNVVLYKYHQNVLVYTLPCTSKCPVPRGSCKSIYNILSSTCGISEFIVFDNYVPGNTASIGFV